MNVILIQGSRRAEFVKKNEFNSEMNYQVTMSCVRQLRKNGIVTEDEYRKIDKIMLKRYSPIFGTLLSENSLTC